MYQNRMNELQQALAKTNITDYIIHRFDGYTLTMLGSFNITYYYEVKLTFHGVDYINCPTFFDTDRIRLGTAEERERYRKQCQLEDEDLMIVFEDDVLNTCYFIICRDFEFEMGTHKL